MHQNSDVQKIQRHANVEKLLKYWCAQAHLFDYAELHKDKEACPDPSFEFLPSLQDIEDMLPAEPAGDGGPALKRRKNF